MDRRGEDDRGRPWTLLYRLSFASTARKKSSGLLWQIWTGIIRVAST
jgi:hypothetical protein